jgi:hypothetical protein
MISKDESIVTQVAAKIASELTCKTETGGVMENIQSAYLAHFDFVRELLVGTHGFGGATNSPIVPQITMTAPTTTTTVNDIASSFNASYETGSGIQVKGTQHGPLPSWLVSACNNAGVTQVWDNRDTANAENRRPLFKAANGPVDAKGQQLAFWAPRK